MAGDNLSWPSEARLIMGEINNHLGFIHGQVIGMCAEWHEGVDSRAQFVRNMRQTCQALADSIERLDTEVFTKP